MHTMIDNVCEEPRAKPLRPGRDTRVTATLGVFGSASTWVFNVARELAIAEHGPGNVHAVFSDSVRDVIDDPRASMRHIVWKLHRPDDDWPFFVALNRTRVVLTVRDPRDAIVSIMQRFGEALEVACARVLHSLICVAENAVGGHLALRYEERFYDQPETVRSLAAYLGFSVSHADQMRIFHAYATENVRQFGLALDRLPPHRLADCGRAARYDVVTQIHCNHIGDRRIGKWRDQFDHDQRRMLCDILAPYLHAFGYEQD